MEIGSTFSAWDGPRLRVFNILRLYWSHSGESGYTTVLSKNRKTIAHHQNLCTLTFWMRFIVAVYKGNVGFFIGLRRIGTTCWLNTLSADNLALQWLKNLSKMKGYISPNKLRRQKKKKYVTFLIRVRMAQR